MRSAMRFLRPGRRSAISAISLLCLLPLVEAQVTSVPGVVVDAQIAFALTASGSAISLANPAGVAIAPDGTIYVADASNSRIVEIATQGAINESPVSNPAKISGAATFLLPAGGLSDPNAVAVGPDGTLYFSDAVKKLLYRVTNPESGAPTYTSLTYSASQVPSALAVDKSGDLWVADASLKQIVEFAPAAITASATASVSPMVPTGIAVSSTSVYFTDANTHAVYGQGQVTPLLSAFAGTNFNFAADQAASRPTGLVLDGAGNLYVLDAANQRLVEFNPATASTAFLIPFSGLTAPAAMGVGPSGNLYLTDDAQQTVNELVDNGNAINFGTLAAGTSSSTVVLNYFFNVATSTTAFYQRMQGDNTSEFAFNNNGCIKSAISAGYSCQQQFHVDYKANTPGLRSGVVALTNSSLSILGPVTSFGVSQAASVALYPGTVTAVSQSAPNPTLLEPQGLAVSGGGNDLFIADEGGQLSGNSYTYTGQVYDYPQAGGSPTKVGGSTLVAPSALALNAAGDLYIADYIQSAIYIASAANRSTVTKMSIPGSVTLYHPIALAFDPSGDLYIGDTGPAANYASASSPGFVVKVPAGGGAAVQFNYSIGGAPVVFPQALATDPSGNLYIADAGDGQTTFGDLVLIPAKTGTPSYIATTGYTLTEPAGLSFDDGLNLYVLDGYNPRILVLPVTLAGDGTPSVGAAVPLPQSISIATGSSLVVWPGAQQISVTDIGEYANAPVTQVITLQTKTAAVAFGPIPLGSSQSESITAVNIGNTLATFTPQFTETGDTAAFTGPSTVCSGGIAVQQQCSISLTYQPDQNGTTTAQFVFNVNGAPSNIANATGTSTLPPPNIVLTISTPNLTYPNGTNDIVAVSGNFGTPSGNVEVFDGTTLLATLSLGGDGKAYGYINYGTLAVGMHYLTAYYLGNSSYGSATSAPVTVIVSPQPVTLNVSCYSNNNYAFGGNYVCGTSTSPQATGNLVYTSDGVANTVPLVNGSAGFTVTDPGPGNHTVVVSYAAQGNFAAATPVTENYTISKATTQLQLTPSSYYAPAGQPLLLSATVVSYNPTQSPNAGTVTFTDNGVTIGQVNVVGGSAILTIQSPVAGSHAYVATYSGTSEFTTSSGNATVTVH
jgi:sugar lactone lactonase YvrE